MIKKIFFVYFFTMSFFMGFLPLRTALAASTKKENNLNNEIQKTSVSPRVLKSLAKEIDKLKLQPYEKAGQKVIQFLRKTHSQIDLQNDEMSFAEKFDLAYQDVVRPGALENLSIEPQFENFNHHIDHIHKAVLLRQKYSREFRNSPKVRARIQTIFLGLLHVMDAQIRNELDSSLDNLLRLRKYLLSQGTFITKGQNRVVTDDLWWDWLWLRGNNYATDLVEWHLQKIKNISLQSGQKWQIKLRKHAISTVLLSLRRNSQPLLGREKNATLQLRLTEYALELLDLDEHQNNAIAKELKLHHYRALQANGLTYEASQIKKEIAKDLFIAKGWQIVKSPAEPWQREDLDSFHKLFLSFTKLINSIFTFFTYGAGFLFVATPIEFLLIFVAFIILSRQGEIYFNEKPESLKNLFMIHRLQAGDGWLRIPFFLRDIFKIILHEIGLAWRMFVASYTMTGIPFYSKVAASLLLFGVGLYFNSARALVEAVVQQMTTM